jgi:hypothetical protein
MGKDLGKHGTYSTTKARAIDFKLSCSNPDFYTYKFVQVDGGRHCSSMSLSHNLPPNAQLKTSWNLRCAWFHRSQPALDRSGVRSVPHSIVTNRVEAAHQHRSRESRRRQNCADEPVYALRCIRLAPHHQRSGSGSVDPTPDS